MIISMFEMDCPGCGTLLSRRQGLQIVDLGAVIQVCFTCNACARIHVVEYSSPHHVTSYTLDETVETGTRS
jgi:hypothetical protein